MDLNRHKEIQELAEKYFAIELGMNIEDMSEAARNTVGAFEVLLRIQERLKKEEVL